MMMRRTDTLMQTQTVMLFLLTTANVIVPVTVSVTSRVATRSPFVLSTAAAKDYCQWETFNATCQSPDHVIVMTSARYGRIADGRCAKKDYGAIGCAADVLAFADSRCSGRAQCTISVADISIQGIRPCPPDLTSYFEAGYRCVQVEVPVQQPCSASRFTRLTSSFGHLASVQPSLKPSGNSCKWLIETDPGRRINLTIYDFTGVTSSSGDVTHSRNAPMTSAFCRRLAFVRDAESGQETNVCSEPDRFRQVTVSTGSRLEVTMATSQNGNSNTFFILRYEATGCGKKNLPSTPGTKAEISADGLTAIIECDVTNHVRWLLKCVESEWRGEIGNCSVYNNEGSADEYMWSAILPDGWTSPYGVVVVISLGVLFGLIIGSSLLGVAVCLLKWKRQSSQSTDQTGNTVDEIEYAPGCHGASGSSSSQKRSAGYCDCTWSPHELLQQTNLIWQAIDTPPTANVGTKTYGRNTSGRSVHGACVTTPDLFADSSTQPEVLVGSVGTETTLGGGRVLTTHFYESPIFSHRECLLD